MKRALLLQIFLLGLRFPQVRAATVYANSFDTSASLAGFTTLGVGSISVENQQLKATITSRVWKRDGDAEHQQQF